MSLIERKIDLTFQLANDQFGDGQGDIVTVSGLRCEATIDNINGIELGSLQLRVYGMLPSDMAKLVTLGKRYMVLPKNVVTVVAGDDQNGMSQVFKGTIYQGWIDYTGMPEVSLNISAQSAFFENMKSCATNTYPGSSDVAAIVEALATSMGFTFRNNGVTSQLNNHYLCGTGIAQLKDVAQSAGISLSIENGEVAIWPNGGTRDEETALLSAETGLVGYPTYSGYGIDVQSIFNPSIRNGRKVTVNTDLPQGSGDYFVQVTRHELSSQLPGGPWFTTAQLTGDGFYVAH